MSKAAPPPPSRQGADDDLGTSDAAIELIAALLRHTKANPGAIFNVGVVPPRPEEDANVPEALQEFLENATTHAAVRQSGSKSPCTLPACLPACLPAYM